jgi:hypothetical protein
MGAGERSWARVDRNRTKMSSGRMRSFCTPGIEYKLCTLAMLFSHTRRSYKDMLAADEKEVGRREWHHEPCS